MSIQSLLSSHNFVDTIFSGCVRLTNLSIKLFFLLYFFLSATRNQSLKTEEKQEKRDGGKKTE